jgi:dihydrolipoamide dehydrogenase
MYDAIIIGGGPSGLAAAARIGQLGGKAALIEKSELGGVCTNWGCIPTKAMVASAKLIHELKFSENLGIIAKPKIDFDKVIKHRDKQIFDSRKISKKILTSFRVKIIKGEGKIIDKNTVEVKNTKYKTKNIIYCVGSRPSYPPFVKLSDKILTSKQLVRIRKRPKKLVVIGGGVIGVEFATIFSSLGSKVTIIEMANRLLFNEDKEIGQELKKAYKKQGIDVKLGKPFSKIDSKYVYVGKEKIPYDKVLIATGRRPILNEEMLKSISIKYDKHGIKVNSKMQTSIKNIYSIGDSTGKSILAHVGIRQGIVAANNIMKKKDSMDYTVPRCVYSIPEVAAVGKTTNECKNPKTFTYELEHNPKYALDNHHNGFIKVILEKNKLVGFQMIGYNVSELINEATLILRNNIPARKIMDTIHPHPTLGESIKFAVQMAYGELVEAPKS